MQHNMTWNNGLAFLLTWVASLGSWEDQTSLGSWQGLARVGPWQGHDPDNLPVFIRDQELLKFLHFTESKCYNMKVTVCNRSIAAEILDLVHRNFYPVEIETEIEFVLDLKLYNFRDSRFKDHRLCRLYIYHDTEELRDMLGDGLSVYEEDVYGVNYSESDQHFQKICKKMFGLISIEKSLKCFDENPSELLKLLVPATPYLPFISKIF